MFFTKKICVIGYNNSFSLLLIQQLLKSGAYIYLVTDRTIPNLVAKDPLKKIKVINPSSLCLGKVLASCECVINTLTAPSPSNVVNFAVNFTLSKKIVSLVNSATYFIHLTPLIKKSIFSTFYTRLKLLEDMISKTCHNYNIMSCAVIFSENDSIIEDMQKIYNIIGKAISPNYSFTYIDKHELVSAIIALSFNHNYINKHFELGSDAKITTFDLNKALKIEIKNKKAKLSILDKILLTVIHHIKCYSIEKKYLHLLSLSKKVGVGKLNLRSLGISPRGLDYISSKYAK